MDVDHKLAGKKTEHPSLESYLTGIGKIRGPKKDSGRDAA